MEQVRLMQGLLTSGRLGMRNPSLYRIGGSALVIGAVLDGVALLIHPPQPMDLTAFAALPHGQWVAAHWLFSVGTVFLVAGLLGAARRLFGANSDRGGPSRFVEALRSGAVFGGACATAHFRFFPVPLEGGG